jgi:DNA (cytosine-5)-methyltransferase 1
MGYHAGWCCYGAFNVGAAHRRERVFIVAYSDGKRFGALDEGIKKQRTGMFKPGNPSKIKPEIYEGLDTHGLLRYLGRGFTEPRGGVIRNDDGISEGLDRVRCLGNAVVPQQVYPILEGIANYERGIWNAR